MEKSIALAIPVIKKWEGFRAKVYRDPVGKATVGYGTLITPEFSWISEVTKEQAEDLLVGHVEKDYAKIKKVVGDCQDYQMAAFLSFAYNLGTGALLKSTLIRFHLNGEYEKAAAQFDRWVYAGGKKFNGLINRRKEEKLLYSGGMTITQDEQDYEAREEEIIPYKSEGLVVLFIKLFKWLFSKK
jgi:lysozyme